MSGLLLGREVQKVIHVENIKGSRWGVGSVIFKTWANPGLFHLPSYFANNAVGTQALRKLKRDSN